jgi:hypothetical protein
LRNDVNGEEQDDREGGGSKAGNLAFHASQKL